MIPQPRNPGLSPSSPTSYRGSRGTGEDWLPQFPRNQGKSWKIRGKTLHTWQIKYAGLPLAASKDFAARVALEQGEGYPRLPGRLSPVLGASGRSEGSP